MNYSTDISLIIETCKTTQDEAKIQKLIQSIIHWDEFIDLAYAHGVFPLVYRILKTFTDIIPSTVLQNMKLYNMDIVKENMLMTAELIKIMKLLEENNIEAIAFKGPTLSQMAYGDITLRQYCDLDILIDKKDIYKSYELLTDTYSSKFKKKYFKNDLYLDKNSDIQFFNTKNNMLIEIHWKLFRNQFSKNSNHIDLFKNKSGVIIQNYKLYTFQDEILLVYLCMHGSKHCWERISWILDINKLLRSNLNLNWEFIAQQAKDLECEAMLNLGLELSNKLFSTPISYKYTSNDTLIIFVEKSFDSLYLEQTEVNRNTTAFKFHYALNDTLYQKIKFLTKTIFPINSQDILEVNLPKNLYILYYILKPFRLLIKYISKLFK